MNLNNDKINELCKLGQCEYDSELSLYYRDLDNMPFDKRFDDELCHATGRECCLTEKVNDPSEWWNEYKDQDGNYHYGR